MNDNGLDCALCKGLISGPGAKRVRAARTACAECSGVGSVGTGECETVYAGSNANQCDYTAEITRQCGCVVCVPVCSTCLVSVREHYAHRRGIPKQSDWRALEYIGERIVLQ